MSLDITPMVPQGRQIIQGFGEGAFRVSGVEHGGSVVVFLDETVAWNLSGDIDAAALDIVIQRSPRPELLIIGCGETFLAPPAALTAHLKGYGVALEWMATDAACRTYNVLAIEERQVAAALLAID